MNYKESLSGFINDLVMAHSDESLLLEVTAYDPLTREPVYGEVITSSKSRLLVVETYERIAQKRYGQESLELVVLHGSFSGNTADPVIRLPDRRLKIRNRLLPPYPGPDLGHPCQ